MKNCILSADFFLYDSIMYLGPFTLYWFSLVRADKTFRRLRICFQWYIRRTRSNIFPHIWSSDFRLSLSMCILKNTFKRSRLDVFCIVSVTPLETTFRYLSKESGYLNKIFRHHPFLFFCALPMVPGTCSGMFQRRQALDFNNWLCELLKKRIWLRSHKVL